MKISLKFKSSKKTCAELAMLKQHRLFSFSSDKFYTEIFIGPILIIKTQQNVITRSGNDVVIFYYAILKSQIAPLHFIPFAMTEYSVVKTSSSA